MFFGFVDFFVCGTLCRPAARVCAKCGANSDCGTLCLGLFSSKLTSLLGC